MAEFAIDIGSGMISIVKTNTNLFCTDTTEKSKKNLPGGSYLMLKIKYTVTGDRTPIYIGYNYNYWKVIVLIST